MSDSKIHFETNKLKRFVIAALVASFCWPFAQTQAQIPTGPVVLGDVPLFSTVTVQPNIMFTLDNSGSMAWMFAPMWVNPGAGSDLYAGRYCLANWRFNNLYYNPAIVYNPPVTAAGSRFPDANYNSAWLNGFDTSDGTINLATNYPTLANYRTALHQTGTRGGFYATYTGSEAVFDRTVCAPNASYAEVDVNTLTAAQRTNFANWYSYYRSRILAMKTSVGEAFRTVDDKFRVGFHTINNPGGGGTNGRFLAVDTFTGAHRANWYAAFYTQDVGSGTPLLQATWRIGEYYKSARSPATGSTLSAANDPIRFSCQQNYHILSTDGQWNGASPGAPGGTNYDNVLPNDPALLAVLGTEFGTTFLAGDPWPRPYRENPGSSSNQSLSDLTTYYWMTDLRPALVNNVATSSGNGANWQHMVSYGVAFSEQGTIPYPNGLTSIVSGASDWPLPVADAASAVDDLWHSSLNGHGQYFNVTSPTELTSALGRALNEIRARSGSLSGGQFSSTDLTGSATTAFRAGFTSGDWSGEVAAYPVDASSGAVSTIKIWSAKTLLDAMVAPAGAGGGWQTTRKIATRRSDSGIAVPFSWANLSADQRSTLTTDPVLGAQMVDYLRGDRSNEDGGGVVRLFRQRTGILGDIAGSETIYVAAPGAPYSESYNPGYEAFKAAKAGRSAAIYVGSNDGMLHAFDAATGQELWAYVPALSYQPGLEGLAGLTYRNSDPIPNQFAHRYRVDQTPFVQDIDFGQTVGGTGVDWRSILVAGMNKGGRGYYALDVTEANATGEADVAAKVLWEFTGDVAKDPKMGYSFGEPLMFKTRRFGWVVAVSSGYNNGGAGDGKGYIWLLNPRTGAVLHRFESGVGSSAVPSGLARTNIFMASSRQFIADQIYATDLMGNVHRFDVSAATAAGWTATGSRIASVGQPLTTAPVIAVNPFNAAERWVFFGSGRLLSNSDISVGAASRMYAIKDGGSAAPATFGAPLTAGDLTMLPLNGSIPSSPLIKGWYAQMSPGQYIITAATITRGAVVWSTTIPTTDPCSPGATSETYVRAIGNGSNLVIGGVAIQSGANIVKTTTVKLVNPNPINSKKRYKLTFDRGDGTTGPGARDQNLDFTLTGGRTGVRFVTTQ